jgi:hypothetical protein
MNWLRRLLVLLTVVALLGGSVWVYRDGLSPPGQTSPAGQSPLDEKDRAAKLEQRRQYQLMRHRGQAQVIQDLAAGRCTLLVAASRFRALYEGDQLIAHALHDAYPAATEDECICRWVIGYTKTDQEGEPGTPELIARLEKEMQEHLERGTLRLSAP